MTQQTRSQAEPDQTPVPLINRPVRGYASGAAMSVLREVMFSVHRHNEPASWKPAAPEIRLDHVLATDADLISFTLSQEGREERFTTDGEFIYGRGGRFHGGESNDRALLLATVAQTTPVPEASGYLKLAERLAERGFVLHEAPGSSFSCSHHLIPLIARHPDGRVLWCSLVEADHQPRCFSLNASNIWLASFYGHDQETEAMLASTDEEWADLGMTPFEALTPSTYCTSGEALDALICMLPFPTDRDWDLPVVPHTVPRDFFKRIGEFEDASLTVTRAMAQDARARRQEESRRRQEAASAAAGDPEEMPEEMNGEKELPF